MPAYRHRERPAGAATHNGFWFSTPRPRSRGSKWFFEDNNVVWSGEVKEIMGQYSSMSLFPSVCLPVSHTTNTANSFEKKV